MKICKKCLIEKEESEFYKKEKLSNRLESICKECKNKSTIEYRKNNPSYKKIHQEQAKKYRDYNINDVRERSKKYYYNNREKSLKNSNEYQKKYLSIKDNRDRRNKKINIRFKERMKMDKLFAASVYIKKSIKWSFKSKNYIKSSKTEEILGCSFMEFKSYLEIKFESWMSWNNHGLYNGEFNFGWDLDHIIPISSAKTHEDLIKLNYYTNFQPLCGKVNRDIKKDNLYE